MIDAQIQVGPDGLLTPAVDYALPGTQSFDRGLLLRYLEDGGDVVEVLAVIRDHLKASGVGDLSSPDDSDEGLALESVKDAIELLGGNP